MVTTVSCLAWLKSTYCIHASFEWCEACIEWIKDEYQNSPLSPRKVHELVFEQWLHADLKDIGEPCLPDGLRTQEQAHLTGVHSLQVESLRDVSTPAYSQLQKLSGKDDPEDLISTATQPTQRWQTKPNRMLMLHLTDGSQTIQGMEYRPIPDLDVSIQPGCKIQICGNVQCRLGVLMLMASNVKVLGGEVESLQEENSQQLVLSRAIGVEAQALPPQITAGNTTDNVEENMTLHSTNDTTRHAGHTASFQSSEPTITGQHHHNRQNMQSGLLQSDNQTCLNSGLVISQHSRHQAVRETTHTQQTHPQPSMTEEEAWMEEEMDVDDDDILDEELLQQLDQIEQRELQATESINTPPASSTSMEAVSANHNTTWNNPMAKATSISNSTSMEARKLDNLSSSTTSNTNTLGTSSPNWNSPGMYNTPTNTANHTGIKLDPKPHLVKQRSVTQFFKNPELNQSPVGQQHGPRTSPVATHGISVRTPSTADTAASMLTTAWVSPVNNQPNTPVTNLSMSSVGKQEMKHPQECKQACEAEHVSKEQAITEPIVYLSDVLKDLSFDDRRVVSIKGFIMTLQSGLRCHPSWCIEAKINDGTASIDVDLTHIVLNELIGFNAQEMKKIKLQSKHNKEMNHKIMMGIQKCQATLTNLCCIMKIEFSPDHIRPVIIDISQVNQGHYQQLFHKVGCQ